mmetsp:Transcript_43669/g.115319  ORF Transcript_43669/g.115319 Transcript_43669/m.115319 type:complete len:268 (-) Transcript_43669:14-817(-)
MPSCARARRWRRAATWRSSRRWPSTRRRRASPWSAASRCRRSRAASGRMSRLRGSRSPRSVRTRPTWRAHARPLSVLLARTAPTRWCTCARRATRRCSRSHSATPSWWPRRSRRAPRRSGSRGHTVAPSPTVVGRRWLPRPQCALPPTPGPPTHSSSVARQKPESQNHRPRAARAQQSRRQAQAGHTRGGNSVRTRWGFLVCVHCAARTCARIDEPSGAAVGVRCVCGARGGVCGSAKSWCVVLVMSHEGGVWGIVGDLLCARIKSL